MTDKDSPNRLLVFLLYLSSESFYFLRTNMNICSLGQWGSLKQCGTRLSNPECAVQRVDRNSIGIVRLVGVGKAQPCQTVKTVQQIREGTHDLSKSTHVY